MYVGPISRLIASYGVEHHQYADDIQILTRMTIPVTSAISRLQACVESLQHWFWMKGLLLNPSKPSLMYFGTESPSITHADSPIAHKSDALLSVTAFQVILQLMCYMNYLFMYLLTYLLTCQDT